MGLFGDTAGSVDPSWGHGTSLLFQDVRELSDRLLTSAYWKHSIAGYAARRAESCDVLRAYDRRTNLDAAEKDLVAGHRRERRNRAKGQDSTLGGFKLIGALDLDGLVADETGVTTWVNTCKLPNPDLHHIVPALA